MTIRTFLGKLLVLAVLVKSLSQCEKDPDTFIDPEIQPYVDMFIEDAKKYGKPHNIYKDFVVIEFNMDDPNRDHAAFSLKMGQDGINIEISRIWWEMAPDEIKRVLVYHELGHDFYNLDHHGSGIMRANVWRSYTEQDFEEFFNLVK